MRSLRLLTVLVIAAVIAAGCGGDEGSSDAEVSEPAHYPEADDASAGEEPATTDDSTTEDGATAPVDDGSGYSVAFVMDGFADDGGWNTSHGRAIDLVRAALPGLAVQVIEEIPPGQSAINAFDDLASDGVDVVVGTTYYMDEALEVAGNHPDTVFLTWAGYITADNVGHFDAATEDGRYLDGLVAGSLTESGIIGYPAGFPIEEVNRAMNAFSIGVREVNPDATVQAVFINSWFDPPAEQLAAESLVNAGADVLAHELNSPAVASVAEDRGINVIGYTSDRSDVAPTAWASSFTFEWGDYYVEQIQAVIAGSWEPALVYGGLADGFIGAAPYGPEVSEDILALVEQRREEITAGTFDYFAGPLLDNEGNEVVEQGATIGVGERSTCCLYLLAGIEGSIPG